MRLEDDYVLREVQKLTLFLRKLIGLVLDLRPDEFDDEIEKVEQGLEAKFHITLKEISDMSVPELRNRLKDLNEVHIEPMAELMYNVIKKSPGRSANNLTEKAITMLDYLDDTSETASIARMNLKNALHKLL